MLNFEKYKDELNHRAGLKEAMLAVYLEHAENVREHTTDEELIEWFSSDIEKNDITPKLTDKEKTYIKNVLDPFKEGHTFSVFKYRWVRECDPSQFKSKERICIYMENPTNVFDCWRFDFPEFEAGTRYKNMIPDIDYTLEELGISLSEGK